MEKKLERFLRLYPWFGGLSADLLFWIAIDTLFLQLVKGMELSDIVLANSISYVGNIVLQLPMMKLVERLGTTRSVKVGVFVSLTAALVLTFGSGIVMLSIGLILHQVTYAFKSMLHVILENNLGLLGRESEYIKLSTSSSTIYATITAVISLGASFLFNLNHYLPNGLCIFFCALCCVLSIWMVDYSDERADGKPAKKAKLGFNLPRLILLAILSFGVFFAIVETGQQNGKLFIQDELLAVISEENAALVVGAIVLISRIARIVSNVFFYRIYAKLGDRVGVLLAGLLCSSFALMIIGCFVEFNVLVKFAVMGLGYVMILLIRDPDKLYIYNLILKTVEKELQPRVIMLLELSKKALAAVINFSFSALLVEFPMSFIVGLYVALGALQIGIAAILLSMVKKSAVIH